MVSRGVCSVNSVSLATRLQQAVLPLAPSLCGVRSSSHGSSISDISIVIIINTTNATAAPVITHTPTVSVMYVYIAGASGCLFGCIFTALALLMSRPHRLLPAPSSSHRRRVSLSKRFAELTPTAARSSVLRSSIVGDSKPDLDDAHVTSLRHYMRQPPRFRHKPAHHPDEPEAQQALVSAEGAVVTQDNGHHTRVNYLPSTVR